MCFKKIEKWVHKRAKFIILSTIVLASILVPAGYLAGGLAGIAALICGTLALFFGPFLFIYYYADKTLGIPLLTLISLIIWGWGDLPLGGWNLIFKPIAVIIGVGVIVLVIRLKESKKFNHSLLVLSFTAFLFEWLYFSLFGFSFSANLAQIIFIAFAVSSTIFIFCLTEEGQKYKNAHKLSKGILVFISVIMSLQLVSPLFYPYLSFSPGDITSVTIYKDSVVQSRLGHITINPPYYPVISPCVKVNVQSTIEGNITGDPHNFLISMGKASDKELEFCYASDRWQISEISTNFRYKVHGTVLPAVNRRFSGGSSPWGGNWYGEDAPLHAVVENSYFIRNYENYSVQWKPFTVDLTPELQNLQDETADFYQDIGGEMERACIRPALCNRPTAEGCPVHFNKYSIDGGDFVDSQYIPVEKILNATSLVLEYDSYTIGAMEERDYWFHLIFEECQ